jgi:hypothetical protein
MKVHLRARKAFLYLIFILLIIVLLLAIDFKANLLPIFYAKFTNSPFLTGIMQDKLAIQTFTILFSVL